MIILSSLFDFKALYADDEPTALTQLIEELKKADEEEATAFQNYSVSTATRSNLISKNADSIKKIMSPLRAYLQAMYGKEDQQFINLNKILNQITGFKAGRSKKNPDEKSISTSQQSYASVTQVFSGLIATLQTLNPPFNPPNKKISLTRLQEKYQSVKEANTLVTNSFNLLNTIRRKRNDLDQQLSIRLKRIKKSIQAQYGNSSTEYAKIKGYSF